MSQDVATDRIADNQRLINQAFCAMHAHHARQFFLERPLELKKGEVYDFDGTETVIHADVTIDAVTRPSI